MREPLAFDFQVVPPSRNGAWFFTSITSSLPSGKTATASGDAPNSCIFSPVRGHDALSATQNAAFSRMATVSNSKRCVFSLSATRNAAFSAIRAEQLHLLTREEGRAEVVRDADSFQRTQPRLADGGAFFREKVDRGQ